MQIFLSHTTSDKEVVEAIGSWLTARGYTVWIDKWMLTPGDSLIDKIGEGIEASDKLVVFLSPESVESNWVKKEVNTGQILELAEEKGLGSKFVIPVVLKPSKIPVMLRDKLYANFTNKDFDAACQELLNGILDSPTGPLDIKLENRIMRHTNVLPLRGKGKYGLIVEFGVVVTPTNGAHLGIDVGSPFIYNEQWFNLPNINKVPDQTGTIMQMEYERIEPPVFEKRFEGPPITSSKSYYIYFESNEPFGIRGVEFKDYYGREI